MCVHTFAPFVPTYSRKQSNTYTRMHTHAYRQTDRQTHAHTHFMVVSYVVGVATTKGDDDLLDDWLNDLNSITSSNSQQVCIRVVCMCACV